MGDKKIKIYFCDLVHNYSGVGSYTFPLNIGYLAAFVNKTFPGSFDIELFKYPAEFMEKMKSDPADIVGFSYYTWSADLNSQMAKWVKSFSPETIVIFGGPNITYSEKGYRKFFTENTAVDFYALYQGEIALSNILKLTLEKGLDTSLLKKEPIDGVVFYDKEKDIFVKGNNIPRIKEMDTVPSPYLTGILDKFFEANLIPIVETNRGCPYTCTYCCQGFSSYNQIEFFSLDRVKAELKYIADRVKNTNILLFADSNFGILPRDVEIAKYISQLMQETGYPRRVSMNWAKNQPKIFEIAKILKNINMIISLQSLDEVVLKNIKRQNIETKIFRDIIDRVNAEGGISGTEIILALPGETKESHLNSLRRLFDWDVSYAICYNCLILEGSEMALQRERGDLKCKTKFRLIDNSFGKYGAIAEQSNAIISFETEEGVRELETMSEEEILYFRPVHWLIQFLWNYRFYYDLLKYLQSLGVNPIDFITRLIDDSEKNDVSEKVKNIFQEFKKEARAEWFDTPEQLREHYAKTENFEYLKQGNYGKMNSKYIFKMLLEAKSEFEGYLLKTALNFGDDKKILEDLINFQSARIIDFTKPWDEILQKQNKEISHNILDWQDSKYQRNLNEFALPEIQKFNFYLPEEQQKSIEILMKQYMHQNKNVTLRKMSEFMDIRDFFYKVRKN